MQAIDKRRKLSACRFAALKKRLGPAGKRYGGRACVYATGSFGRCEAGKYSDLDVFIVGGETAVEGGPPQRALTRLDEICLKAEIIAAARGLKFPEFSGDGAWLTHQTADDLIRRLGTPEDDSTNAFTARLLLLLESKSLLGDNIFLDTIDSVIARYWDEFKNHQKDFAPTFLANDILRLWRTFCVNYESRTRTRSEAEKAKRRLKNFKLKHSRLLTCYSGLLYLLGAFQDKGTVTPEDARGMVTQTPIERIECLAKAQGGPTALRDILQQYDSFLEQTDASEQDLIARFQDPKKRATYNASAEKLADAVWKAMRGVGGESRFFRQLVV